MKKQLFYASALLVAGAVLVLQSCKKEDVTDPEITIQGGNTAISSLNATFTNPTATATDAEDGDLTASITVEGTVNKDLAGVYTLTYKATDAAGNTGSAMLTVTVRNDAYALAGTYEGKETDINGPYTYVQDNVVTADTLVNNKIWITRLGDFANNTVYMNVVGTSVTMPQQTVANVGTGSATCDVHSRKSDGSGTISTASGTVISLTYNDEKVAPCSGTRTAVAATFTKK